MKYYLLKEECNWGDEFDIAGFKIQKSKLNLNPRNVFIVLVTVYFLFLII